MFFEAISGNQKGTLGRKGLKSGLFYKRGVNPWIGWNPQLKCFYVNHASK